MLAPELSLCCKPFSIFYSSSHSQLSMNLPFLPLLAFSVSFFFFKPAWENPNHKIYHNRSGSVVNNTLTMQERRVWSLSWEDPLEKAMATHSGVPAWEIPWTEKPGGLQSMGSQKSWTIQQLNNNKFSPSLWNICNCLGLIRMLTTIPEK